MNISLIAKKIKRELFPSKHQLTVRKWVTDGGDSELRFNYDLTQASTILDLGGYVGQWASDIYSRYKCRVFVFEPVKLFADRIVRRFSRNNDIEVFPFGLGATSRDETISLADDGSSIFGRSGVREAIRIVDVKEWVDGKGVEQIDLMKVNIEGGEYELLDRLFETRLIERIANIQVQFHKVSDTSGAQMRRAQDMLRETHIPTYQYEFVWENWKRVSKVG